MKQDEFEFKSGYELTEMMLKEMSKRPHHDLSLRSSIAYIRFYGIDGINNSIGKIRLVGQEAIKRLDHAIVYEGAKIIRSGKEY